MPQAVNTCPKCGALVVPQLSRCRVCKEYLHGTRVEGLLIENLIPAQLQEAPATATIILFIVLYYALMLALAGERSIVGFSAYSVQQLGGTYGIGIWLGEYWRLITANFGHSNPLHLILNLAALAFVGRVVETILDRKKMFLIYLGSGVFSMFASYVWYAEIQGLPQVPTNGASGAIAGMIGAAWFAARKLGPKEADVVRTMKRWTILMAVWGLMPHINNAAHAGGFVAGALLAHFTPVGHAKTVAVQRVLSVIALAAFAMVLGSIGLMLKDLRGYSAAYDDHLDYQIAVETCSKTFEDKAPIETTIDKCERARRVFPEAPMLHIVLAQLYSAKGDAAQAAKYAAVAQRLMNSADR